VRRRRQGSFVAWIRNFTDSEIPLPRRILAASRNTWLRVVARQTCCGHDGEPGC
jgi:hypothetical protein